ncbi:CheY-P-specific phosphatase CheC [Bacillus lacus]|uniref:CheY-P-specific phosphatase CheC n=1 Tax=Metabacillus lacus TaxID=1983721 RepID=A0A7X2IVN4_9BACI|nr:chemotaxis protein CheC [Metabacillus lacus]MRX70616.1 CheY-P-specific phosphatase CheC [Metabacillus lacus]
MGAPLITQKGLDVVKEISNIGAGHAATALSNLLSKKICMSIPSVEVVSFNKLHEWLHDPDLIVASVFLRLEGDISGSMYLLLNRPAAEALIRKVIKDNSFSLAKPPYNEVGMSALKEIGNILSSSYLSALSDFTHLRVHPSVPLAAVDMFGAIISQGLLEVSLMHDSAIALQTVMKEEDPGGSTGAQILLFPDPDGILCLAESLGGSYE